MYLIVGVIIGFLLYHALDKVFGRSECDTCVFSKIQTNSKYDR
jgi:hypothetical protein